jgi:TolB-like protein
VRAYAVVREEHDAATRADCARPEARSAPRLSIVVPPFANFSGDPAQEYFIDGMTESLTTDLSRINGSFVIGRHTAFTFKGKAVALKQIGRELNVNYVLEGSVQRGDDRLRVNVQLVDAETGAHLWADRFDKPVAALFDIQDEIVSRLANQLQAQLIEEAARRSERSLHPTSMELYFQGRALLNKGWAPHHLVPARDSFERALIVDPKNIEAMVGTATVDTILGANWMSEDRAALLAKAEATLIHILCCAPNHAFAHVFGAVLAASKRAARGNAECERALALDRNLAEAQAQIGLAKLLMGRAIETEAHVNEALRLSPRDVFSHRWFMIVGIAKLALKEDAEALSWFDRSVEANRNHPMVHFSLAVALVASVIARRRGATDGAVFGY